MSTSLPINMQESRSDFPEKSRIICVVPGKEKQERSSSTSEK